MKSYVRISVLNWTDVLAKYAMWVMVTYLTDVWGVSIRKAAGIVNIWTGSENVMQLYMAIISSEFMGKYLMILLSSIAYTIGLGFLWMSTPPVLSSTAGNCTDYQPECIGETQKVLFYISLALIAIGISGHASSIEVFLKNTDEQVNEENGLQWKKVMWSIVWFLGVVLPVAAGITLPYINPWSVRFGIPALCTLLATFLFITGSRSYYKWCPPDSEGSPVTAVFRVFVASTCKIFQPLPQDVRTKNKESSTKCSYPNLWFLDKAGIILPNQDEEEQQKKKWTFCRPEEIEATKKIVRILPICFTFVLCGVVLSVGNTYFVEQANNLDRKVGSLTVPLSLFLAFYEFAKMFATRLYESMVMQNNLIKDLPEPDKKKKEREIGLKAPIIAIFVVYVYIELSCITAAKVEQRRLHTVRRNGLLDKPDDEIPMSIFWLLPQFLLIASADGLYRSSVMHFFTYHAPWCMHEYNSFFHKAVMGLGTMGSVLCVFLVGKASQNGGRPNWFQFTLNQSRLDRYYWTLAVLCAANFALYTLALCFYDRSKFFTAEPDADIELNLDTDA